MGRATDPDPSTLQLRGRGALLYLMNCRISDQSGPCETESQQVRTYTSFQGFISKSSLPPTPGSDSQPPDQESYALPTEPAGHPGTYSGFDVKPSAQPSADPDGSVFVREVNPGLFSSRLS